MTVMIGLMLAEDRHLQQLNICSLLVAVVAVLELPQHPTVVVVVQAVIATRYLVKQLVVVVQPKLL
jgi:hypothetical protein